MNTVLLERLHDCTVHLRSMTPFSPRKAIELEDRRLEILCHELSSHFQARAFTKQCTDRSTGEAKALAIWKKGRSSSAVSCAAFLDRLEYLNSVLTGGSSGRRQSAIGTVPDRAGVRIEFPAIGETRPQLCWLRRQIYASEADRLPTVLVATAALVILTNAHLFTDGNGRLSRAIFNHILHRGGLPGNVYIPVYEFALRSCGGFLIRVRQAELRGEWAPIIEYIMNMLQICAELALTDSRGCDTINGNRDAALPGAG